MSNSSNDLLSLTKNRRILAFNNRTNQDNQYLPLRPLKNTINQPHQFIIIIIIITKPNLCLLSPNLHFIDRRTKYITIDLIKKSVFWHRNQDRRNGGSPGFHSSRDEPKQRCACGASDTHGRGNEGRGGGRDGPSRA